MGKIHKKNVKFLPERHKFLWHQHKLPVKMVGIERIWSVFSKYLKVIISNFWILKICQNIAKNDKKGHILITIFKLTVPSTWGSIRSATILNDLNEVWTRRLYVGYLPVVKLFSVKKVISTEIQGLSFSDPLLIKFD